MMFIRILKTLCYIDANDIIMYKIIIMCNDDVNKMHSKNADTSTSVTFDLDV